MDDDIKKLTELIENATQDIESSEETIEGLSPEYADLGLAVSELIRMAREVYHFTGAMADGDLSIPIPGRHNYLAGPSKDLYYKLQHLTWQAKEVAKGDYSQRVDFLGEFSEAFNYMIMELAKRENQIRQDAQDQIRLVELQNEHLKQEVERQMLNYHAYHDYVRSFHEFRTHYKDMMGEVYELFQQKKYEEGRNLIAKINDRMASEVIISKKFSNNEFIDAGMAELDKECRDRDIGFSGTIHLPEESKISSQAVIEQMIVFAEFVRTIMDIKTHTGRKIHIQGSSKNSWISIRIGYHAEEGLFPETVEEFLPQECRDIIGRIRTRMDEKGDLFNLQYMPERRSIQFCFHIAIGG